MNFVIGLLIYSDWKGENYDLIIVIIDWLTKMVYYILVKIIIHASGFTQVILDIVVKYYRLPNSIICD